MTGAACGTSSGYNRHRADGETPCEACRKAHNATTRRSNRVRGRALTRLSQMYQDTYVSLYRQEMHREKSPP